MNSKEARAIRAFSSKVLRACDQLEEALKREHSVTLEYARAYYLTAIRQYASVGGCWGSVHSEAFKEQE